MSLPQAPTIETPILQELVATGGTDDVRFLYERLIAYFPQISDKEIADIKNGINQNWRKAVQKAGKALDEKNFIRRTRGLWSITEKGKKIVEEETSGFTLTQTKFKETTHLTIQEMLVEIGESLGFYAEIEFEYYDVIWRETERSQRISHVFEVQSKGNIDSAFAKLKRAYQNQRSKPFLVISSERDTNRAGKSLAQEFQDVESILTILSFAQVKKVHQNIKNIAEILREFLLK
jgi:Mrr N-terminal domain